MNEWFYEECERELREKKNSKKNFLSRRRQQARVGDGGTHTPVVWTSALILLRCGLWCTYLVDLRGSQIYIYISSRAIRSGLSLFPYTRERGEYLLIREALIENDSTSALLLCFSA